MPGPSVSCVLLFGLVEDGPEPLALLVGELLRVGVAMPVAEAAVRLAHLMHGPNMELVFLGARMNDAG